MNNRKFILAGFLCLIFSQWTSAAGDAAKGKALSSACSSCHGAVGVSVDAQYPNLAGQHENYLLQALQQYQSGQRSNAIMQAQVGPLSAQDMENLAAYFSGNAVIPSFSWESNLLHIPYIGVGTEVYQGDLLYLQGSNFTLSTMKPLN